MSERVVAIELKVPDNAAFTALVALRTMLPEVHGVERRDIWRLEDAGEPATLASRVRANQTIFNPNKHRLVELPAAEPRDGEVWIEPAGRSDEVRERLGGTGIAGIVASRRYIGWRLLGPQGVPAPRATVAAAAERLLCNPAIEKAIYR